MKVENEVKVMQWLYWVKCVHNKDLLFKGIINETKILKSTLYKILLRLEKRGWIEKYKIWLRIPTKSFTIGEFFEDVHYTYKKKYLTKRGSSEAKRVAGKKAVREKHIPKEITVYKFLKFPYLFGDMRGITVPKGYKTKWKQASEEAKQKLNEYKNNWKDERKTILSKIKRLENPRISLVVGDEKEQELRQLNYELDRLEVRKIKPVLIKSKPI